METRTAPNTAIVSQEKTISQLFAELSKNGQTLVASLSTDPLVCIVATAYALGLLYLPRYLLSLLLSPVAVSTLLLIATTLLYFGSSIRTEQQNRPPESQYHARWEKEHQQHLEQRQHHCPSPPCAPVTSSPYKPVFWAEPRHFAELTRRGPLEVIYEEYEDDDDGEDSPPGCCQSPGRGQRRGPEGLERLRLRFCTGDSEDDSLSECSGVPSPSPGCDSPENPYSRWEVEEDGLIEISLEEENLIEIDLSACR